VYKYKEAYKEVKARWESASNIVHGHVSSDSICTNETVGDDKGEVAKRRASERTHVRWRHGGQHPIGVRQVPSLPHLDPRAIPNPSSLAFSYQSCFNSIDLCNRNIAFDTTKSQCLQPPAAV
jgi:hypothetical protein